MKPYLSPLPSESEIMHDRAARAIDTLAREFAPPPADDIPIRVPGPRSTAGVAAAEARRLAYRKLREKYIRDERRQWTRI